MTEGVPNEERMIEQSEVLEILRAKGSEDPEVKELVLKWTMQQEAIVTQEGTARARILFEMSRSGLYIAVSDWEGAYQCLEDARVQAHQEGETELYNQIMKDMDFVQKFLL